MSARHLGSGSSAERQARAAASDANYQAWIQSGQAESHIDFSDIQHFSSKLRYRGNGIWPKLRIFEKFDTQMTDMKGKRYKRRKSRVLSL